MLEVEGQDWKAHLLRDRHDRSVDEAELEVGEASVDLDSATHHACRKEDDRVLPGAECFEKRACGPSADAPTEKLVDLHQDGIGNEQLAAQLADQSRGEPMRPVTAIRRGDERPSVGDDSQRAATSSRR